jgi:hypothetical protein
VRDPKIMLIVTVPGALEIPLALQTMAQKRPLRRAGGVGCVIRGETYHFEIVSNESARGITDVQLDDRRADRQRRSDDRERRSGAGAHGAEGHWRPRQAAVEMVEPAEVRSSK